MTFVRLHFQPVSGFTPVHFASKEIANVGLGESAARSPLAPTAFAGNLGCKVITKVAQ
jgi:hypothetical protein